MSNKLEDIARLLRYYILTSTTGAGTGHPTSSLSAVELMTTLMFGGIFRYFRDRPDHPNNDRLIFSKGHASPLFYSLWKVAGCISEQELLTYRRFGSRLEGHPMPVFPFTEAATGSLGQGLSIGVGMAMNARFIDKLPYRTYVLLGDSEMAEGSQWESMQIAAHYRLDNLTGILDINGLGQRGATMYGHDITRYERMISSLGWTVYPVDGHSIEEIFNVFQKITEGGDAPSMILAKTIKGKGISFIENRNGWHGKTLSGEELGEAIKEIGDADPSVIADMCHPADLIPQIKPAETLSDISYPADKAVATRKAYGNALARIFPHYPDMVILDAEVSNSTYAEIFKNAYPERFFEMFIAEQNMVGAAIGFSRRGKIPFVSTFAAFFTRAFDQIRMSRYSDANIKFAGSHAGVSIGEDGPSQMGLEDIAMFRTILDSVVLYPSDAISTERLVEAAAGHKGIVYLRTTRKETPIIYTHVDKFHIGGSHVLKRSDRDRLTIVSAGITLYEALTAYEELRKEGIMVRVIDLYSVKPLDIITLQEAAMQTEAIITVEDHYAEGGIGEAVQSALSLCNRKVYSLSVRRMPCSGRPDELLAFEGISKTAILKTAREVLTSEPLAKLQILSL